MGPRSPRDQYPWWVKFSLFGAGTRRSQWFWIGLSIAAGFLLLVFAADEAGPARYIYLIAAAWGFVAAGLYWATIRWMDRYGRWD